MGKPKIPWSAVFTVLKAVYVAFFKGKVVNLPGGLGPVTLPSQDHTIPGVPRPLAALEWPAEKERRAPAPPRRPDGLPEPVEPPVPLSTATLGVILFVVFGLPCVALIMLGVTEYRTLSDSVEGNHITATLRAMWTRAPGAVFLSTLVWLLFLSAIAWGVLAHAFFA